MSEQDTNLIHRTFTVERLMGSDGEKVKYMASLSSESPVRDFPWEPPHVLLHTRKAVDLSVIADRGLPLFLNHDRHDLNNIVNASKKVLPGLGHIPQIEDPETFVDALLEFLKPGAD
ncbi:MAG: alpha/beta hydrolase [Chloroflexi bacterium]|nr:alpha/beta hydrolase [Chloroflexota bacterium]